MIKPSRHLPRSTLSALLTGLALMILAPPCRADFIKADTGNTAAGTSSTIDGTYNFAVLDKTTTNSSLPGYYTDSTKTAVGNTYGAASNYGPNGVVTGYAQKFDQLFKPGTGSGALNTANRYLYLVQVVNNGTNADGISTVTIPKLAGRLGSFGIFDGRKTTDASDNKGAVSLTNNLGPDGHPFDGIVYTGTVKPGVSSSTTTSTNINTGATVAIVGNDLVITFTGGLANGAKSVLIGFTSDVPPFIRNDAFTLSNGTHTASGQAPVPTPEPGALALAGIGLGCGLTFYLRRKRGGTPPGA